MNIHHIATQIRLGAWAYGSAIVQDAAMRENRILIIGGDRMRPHGAISVMGLANGHIRQAQGLKYEFCIDLSTPAPHPVYAAAPDDCPDPLRIRASRTITEPDQPPPHWAWFLQLHPQVKEYTEYITSLASGLIIQL